MFLEARDGSFNSWGPNAPNTVPAEQPVLHKWCLERDLAERASSLVDSCVRIHFWCAPLVQGAVASTYVSPSVVYCFSSVVVCVPVPCFFGFWSNCEYYMLGDQKSKLFINSKVSLGLESVFLKCVYIWWLYYNLTDVSLDNL